MEAHLCVPMRGPSILSFLAGLSFAIEREYEVGKGQLSRT